jgi:hypothetical protein
MEAGVDLKTLSPLHSVHSTMLALRLDVVLVVELESGRNPIDDGDTDS